MTIKKPSLKTIKNSMSFSLRTIILIMLFVVSIIPLAFILPSLVGGTWDSLYKENLQTNKLLASSLIEPINLKLESYQYELKLLDLKLQATSFQNAQEIISTFNNSYDDIVSVSLLLLSENNAPVTTVKNALKNVYKSNPPPPKYISKEFRYLKYDQEDSISPIMRSSFSDTPILLIKHQIIDNKFKKIGTIFAEIEPKFIRKLCDNISFGEKGHCIVVDNKSNVIAHPNKSWVSSIHNLSNHKLVQACKLSNTGSLEFKSSNNIDMIGAYAKVQDLNWGVLVARPKAEIALPVKTFTQNTLKWLIISLGISLLIAIIVIIRLTKPLDILSQKSILLAQKYNTYSLGNAPKNSPKDIVQIWQTLSKLLSKYQELNRNNMILESSSKKDIRKIMNSLRQQKVKEPNNIDPITGLTNITCFKEEVGKSLRLYKGEVAGLIIIEIDNCKPLIAKGKKQLVTLIIKHVAQILNENKRSDDIVAHYGDKCRFTIFINDCSIQALEGMAEKLRSLIEVSPLHWDDGTVYINLSTGIAAYKIDEKTTANSLIVLAEKSLDNSIKH